MFIFKNNYQLWQYDRTPLHKSAVNGHVNVCEFLLHRGAELESLDEVSWTVTNLWRLFKQSFNDGLFVGCLHAIFDCICFWSSQCDEVTTAVDVQHIS